MFTLLLPDFFEVKLNKKIKQVFFCKSLCIYAKTSAFDKAVLCIFFTCCTMGKQSSIHFVQAVTFCTLVLLHLVPIAAITET